VRRVAELGAFDAIAMGYDLHITRKKLHFNDGGPTITLDEWLTYVASDPELRPAPEIGKHAVFLSVASKYPDPWLDWFQGDIYTKNPDEPILAKMLKIASSLGAKVQGDDGEVYRSANFEDCFHED
jgi:hypothetical protein